MTHKQLLTSSLICAVILVPVAVAGDPPLEEVVVTGEYAGPGMWQVTKPGDDSHVLWIIGDPPPLPKRLSWKSKSVEAVVLRSQEILRDASLTMKPDEKIGVFRGLALVPSALKARRNPDDGKLETLLPPALYARWLVQKKRFLGHDNGIEEWRPLFAANKLRTAALKDLDLRDRGMVWDAVSGLAKKNQIRVTEPKLEYVFKADELKAKLKEFQHESLPDVDCLAATISLTEALSDRDTEEKRARAWATADLDGLRALPALPNVALPCITAALASEAARQNLPANIRDQVHALWLREAERALAANESTLAIAPLDKLLADDGYLARLREKGYEIEAPH